jgi:hypothetical protein
METTAAPGATAPAAAHGSAFKPTREGNAIVLAQRTASRPSRDALQQTASAIEEKWGLPAPKWLKVFKPLTH